MKTAQAIDLLKGQIPDCIVEQTNFYEQYSLEVTKANLLPVLSFLKELPNPGFEVLMDLSGVDYLLPVKRTKVVYFLHNPTNYERIRVTVFVERDQSIPSVVHLWEGANWYERELFDLFGIKFDDHPDLTRILMPDDWVGHPLRRDYALTEESVQFKHGVKPKVPSEIIPHITQISPYVKNKKL